MKKAKILNYIFNGLLIAMMAFSSISSLAMPAESEKMMHGVLGYPLYFIGFLGVAKALGCLALIVPGLPRLKEWVYAGFAFDMIAAVYSEIKSGMKPGEWAPIFIFIALLVAAYMCYHRVQRMKAANQ